MTTLADVGTTSADWDNPYTTTGTAIMQATAWVVCGSIDHNFSAVLNWMGGISEIAGFLCSKCGEYRIFFKETRWSSDHPR